METDLHSVDLMGGHFFWSKRNYRKYRTTTFSISVKGLFFSQHCGATTTKGSRQQMVWQHVSSPGHYSSLKAWVSTRIYKIAPDGFLTDFYGHFSLKKQQLLVMVMQELCLSTHTATFLFFYPLSTASCDSLKARWLQRWLLFPRCSQWKHLANTGEVLEN